MDISVIVPTFNRREVVLRSLSTLFAQEYPEEAFEVVVVSDGSTDGTVEALRGLRSRCRLKVVEQENRGPSAARNAGARTAESELLLFVDDDMQCTPGLIAAHVAAHRAHDQIVGFGAILASPDSPPGLALECFKREIGADHLEHSRTAEAPWQNSVFSNTSVPKQLLMNVGGFDETFRMREDLELGMRFHQAGVRSYYVSNAVTYQHYTKTPADLLMEAERFALADMMLVRKHPGERIRGHVAWIEAEPQWKARLRDLFVSSPWLEERVLGNLCYLGERFRRVIALRNMGVRALQARRRVRWLRMVRMHERSGGQS